MNDDISARDEITRRAILGVGVGAGLAVAGTALGAEDNPSRAIPFNG